MPRTLSPQRYPTGLLTLTAVKVVLTTAQRWVPALLPTLTVAYGSTTKSMTSMMALGQLGGILTFVSGHWLNEHTERRFIRVGITVVLLSSLIALWAIPAAFAASFLLLVIGHTHATVASHAWIGHRVPFAERGRAVGAFEVSWSLGLVLGTPILAGVIYATTWRAGYFLLALGCAIAFVAVGIGVPDGNKAVGPEEEHQRRTVLDLPSRAWLPIIASAAAAAAGIGFFAVASTWLADTHHLGARSLGAIAFGYGVVELVAASSVARFSDRLGTRTAMLFGLAALLAVTIALGFVGGSLMATVIGLLGFLMLFEFAFVSSLALVTEAAPDDRGTAIGAASAVGTVGRACGVGLAGVLYVAAGIAGPLAMAAVMTATAIVLIALDRSQH